MNSEKLIKSTTTDGKPPRPGFENAGAPSPIKENGQHESYWVLTEEERQKGQVRPVRQSYVHAGMRPKFPTRDLTAEELANFADVGYVKFEIYPEGYRGSCTGRYWTREQLASGCGSETRMGLALAETYAKQPSYYGATFCVRCGTHLPVAEFVWSGTNEIVGS